MSEKAPFVGLGAGALAVTFEATVGTLVAEGVGSFGRAAETLAKGVLLGLAFRSAERELSPSEQSITW